MMPVTYSNTPQGTDEWLAERAGLITASNARKVAGGLSSRESYIWEVVDERLWGPSTEDKPKTYWMERGNRLEPRARANFELDTGLRVLEVGLATNSDLPGCGASLDGLIVGTDGKEAVEIKCPKNQTMTKYDRQRPGHIPAEHASQLIMQALICELDAIHFYAWSPDRPPYYVRYVPKERDLKQMRGALAEFEMSVQRYMTPPEEREV